jgi:hypothetical protein
VTQWVTDIDGVFAATNELVKSIRVDNSLPALQPSGDILIGKQYLAFEQSAPRIVIVPKGTRYGAARNMQNAGNVGYEPGKIPDRKAVYMRTMLFTAHFWGGPDPQFLNTDPADKLGSQTFLFNTTIELEREFFYALQATMSIPTARPVSGAWNLETLNTQSGGVLEVDFEIETSVFAEPYTILPYAVSSGDTSGVVREVTVEIGASSVGPIIIPGDES